MATNKTSTPVGNDEAPIVGETVLEKADNPEIQNAVDESEEKGYIGLKTDPKPNDFYTVAGQVAAKAEANKQAEKDAK